MKTIKIISPEIKVEFDENDTVPLFITVSGAFINITLDELKLICDAVDELV